MSAASSNHERSHRVVLASDVTQVKDRESGGERASCAMGDGALISTLGWQRVASSTAEHPHGTAQMLHRRHLQAVDEAGLACSGTCE